MITNVNLFLVITQILINHLVIYQDAMLIFLKGFVKILVIILVQDKHVIVTILLLEMVLGVI